ncbi:MAG: ATP synthase F1 subunit gamma [Syntrophales bacterium]|nr:ATP synthase F1 subunit gamma [Syntrophales bacterium]
MAALRDIKRKVTAVQKTRQITRAMNMVAAAKFKSSQSRMVNFRPYASKFMDVLSSLALRVEPDAHPLLAVREPKKLRVISMTSDRGLCGGFNANVIKATERFIRERVREGKEIILIPIGRKGRDYFRKRTNITNERVDVFGRFDMTLAVEISESIIPPFEKEEYDELYLIYNEFYNVAIQRPAVVRMLPPLSLDQNLEIASGSRLDYIYEPGADALLEKLLPLYVHNMIYRALVETSAGENGARMVAMDNATKNCDDLINNLTLKYNKARQASITAELMDIVGGTEALAKG